MFVNQRRRKAVGLILHRFKVTSVRNIYRHLGEHIR